MVIVINSPKYGRKELLFDEEDFTLVIQHNWHLKPERNGNFYAHTNFWRDGKRTGGSIHRHLCPEWKMIDHINGNGLDNRRCNLRESSYKENCKNKKKRNSTTSSKYKGISWITRNKRWMAGIMVNYKKIHLGYWKDELAAATAYNIAARKYHGASAFLNDIVEVENYLELKGKRGK